MINVLVLTPWFPTAKKPGYGVFVMEQTKALVDSTEVVPTVLYYDPSSNFSFKNIYKLFQDEIIIKELIKFKVYLRKGIHLPLRFSITRKLWIIQHIKIFKKYLEENKRPDVIHAHTFWGGLIALELNKRYKIPYIITEHSSLLISENYKQRDYFKRIISKSYKKASKLVAVGPILARKMKEYNFQNIEIIPNSIDTLFFSPFLTKGIENKQIKILTIGGLIPLKQIHLAIKSVCLLFKQGFNITLKIIREGPLRKELEELIKKNNANKYILLLGYRNRDEIKMILNQTNFYLHTSKTETFGIVLIEAMAMGVPVISTMSGGPENFITKETGLIVENSTTEAIVEAIKFMIKNKEDFKSKNIRQYILNNFSNEKVSIRIEKIYKTVKKVK